MEAESIDDIGCGGVMGAELPRLRRVFNEALERDPEERAEYLDGACGEDRRLRERVEALLSAHGEAGGFLAGRESVPGKDGRGEESPEGPGTVIGPYRLMQEIGRGGFGVVYAAEQTAPVRRRVALKILKAGMDTREVVSRFEAE
jgi:hypothetical protein